MAENAANLHLPVMTDEVLSCLQPENGGLYVDGTLGLGGHSQAVLEASAPSGRVIGFEWDRDAAELAADRLKSFTDRITIIHASYADMATELLNLGVEGIDGLLIDLGVSSLQLDSADRGFSFQVDAPLDMRMNLDLQMNAADILARSTEEELADIFYHYGEERQARRIAAHICKVRKSSPVRTTGQLAHLVASAVPRRFHPEKIHVATRVFQALRIAVNRELDNLVRLLAEAPKFLRPGAVFCVITFHSLEDRIVKQAFRKDERLKAVQKRPVRAQDEEITVNPRARSAKLRSALRTEE
jgi:16S rRNA (cytosine1402-N4)-methyltransferase